VLVILDTSKLGLSFLAKAFTNVGPGVASHIMGTLSLEQSRLPIRICVYLILYESYTLATPRSWGRRLTENYTGVATSLSGLRRASF
jgi:hypothetical protein